MTVLGKKTYIVGGGGQEGDRTEPRMAPRGLLGEDVGSVLRALNGEPAADMWSTEKRKFNGGDDSRQFLMKKERNERGPRDPTRNPRHKHRVQRGGGVLTEG